MENPASVNGNRPVHFAGSATLPPEISSPQELASIPERFVLDFELLEGGKSGTLKLVITQVYDPHAIADSIIKREVLFNDDLLSAGRHALNISALSAAGNLAEVVSVNPATDLVDGSIYDFMIRRNIYINFSSLYQIINSIIC